MDDLLHTADSDAWLFGWNPTPGIVSVWADRTGRALVWQRDGDAVRCTETRFRPWLFAATLDDLRHLGGALAQLENAPFSYRELDGPPDSYRYLLSARDGRALTRAILAGAQKRLGRTIQSLHDIGDDYYGVGPVEQYLMLTGQVYFRGLAYTDLHRLQFDLETTALSPKHGRIFMVAVRDTRGCATVLEAPTPADEAGLIRDLCALICERDPDVIENHNLFGFDLPFLSGRAAALDVPLRLGRPADHALLEQYDEPAGWGGGRRTRYTIAGREMVDTLDAVRRHDFAARSLPGHGLKVAAKHFGIAAPDRTYIAGSQIYATYRHDPAQVRRYALDDVIEVDGLSRRLMGAPFALAGMAPRRYERMASAGPAMGILEPMLVRAYLRAGVALPRNAAKGDGQLEPHQGGATILYAGGVARQVVKADIASMYPSIMRTFQIGPACDTLGVLLTLVDRLTDLRLDHKRQAKTAPPDTAEAHHHNAVQSAMKIIINAAYGYMGAGSMALFADRRAADAITRHGREILAHVVDHLREHGMALLEADTDGVFFAVPQSYTEADERQCVAEIAATLPPGIRLEYEGRYAAMLSHEVKNYALLTYGGDLIVRGNAFHSSRDELFGAQFLRAALRCTLTGDIIGLHRTYHDTIAALRQHRLTVRDVATVARLTKTPDAYLATRKRAREAAYEALLAAGRTHWRVGEKVRFYRSADGQAVWLPDAPDADTARSDADTASHAADGGHDKRDYDVGHYVRALHVSYVSRLLKAFAPADFAQLFRPDAQIGLFDQPLHTITPQWIQG